MTHSDKNNVILTGTIIPNEIKLSHELYGEKFYEIKVQIPRLSGTVDILPVTISERLYSEENFSIAQFVSITGQLRSYNNTSNNNDSKLKLTIFAKSIDVVNEISENPNTIVLDGFVCKKPICRQTPFNREIADITLAVNRGYNKSDYIPVIAWGRNAKFCETLEVGSNIKVHGRIQSREYQKKLEDGTTINKTAYEVSISKLEVINKK